MPVQRRDDLLAPFECVRIASQAERDACQRPDALFPGHQGLQRMQHAARHARGAERLKRVRSFRAAGMEGDSRSHARRRKGVGHGADALIGDGNQYMRREARYLREVGGPDPFSRGGACCAVDETGRLLRVCTRSACDGDDRQPGREHRPSEGLSHRAGPDNRRARRKLGH